MELVIRSVFGGEINIYFTDPEYAGLRVYIYNPFNPCSSDSNGVVMRTSVIGLFN